MLYDCLIVGAGPAGLSAAVQLAHYGHTFLVFEKRKVGGLLNNANRIENYLGFPDYTGPDLVREFKKNLKKTTIRLETVKMVEQNKDGIFTVKTSKKTYTARTVLIATGTAPNELKIPHKKVFYDLVDFPFHKGKNILILGGGDVGFDYALNLKQRGMHPTVWTHRKTTCLPILQKRAKEAGIPFFEDRPIVEARELAKADFVLVAVGRHAETPILHVQKPLKGIYSAGDVNHEATRHVQIATGEGFHEALKIHDYLQADPNGSAKQ